MKRGQALKFAGCCILSKFNFDVPANLIASPLKKNYLIKGAPVECIEKRRMGAEKGTVTFFA